MPGNLRSQAMAEPSVHTTILHGWLSRMKAGDLAARDELYRGVAHRLEMLAHQMMRGFPKLRGWLQTDDVLQSAAMRLFRALEQVNPPSMRDFYGLAATQIRRELIDLTRRFKGRQAALDHLASIDTVSGAATVVDRPEETPAEATDLEQWRIFHEAVEKLPLEEREVVSLVFYHGWPQARVAELFQVHVRTIRRWWQSALQSLHEAAGTVAPLA